MTCGNHLLPLSEMGSQTQHGESCVDFRNILITGSVLILHGQRMTSEKYHVKWNTQSFLSHPHQVKRLVTLASSNSINPRKCVWTLIHSANILNECWCYLESLCIRLSNYISPCVGKNSQLKTKVRIIWWLTFKCTFTYFKSTVLVTFFPSSYRVRYLGNPHAGRQARALVFSLGVGVSYQGETSKSLKLLKWEAQMTNMLPVLASCLGWTWNLTNIDWASTVCQVGHQWQGTYS